MEVAHPGEEANKASPSGLSDVHLEVREVSKSFGAVTALDGVSLKVRRGEVVGLVGDNGAGKSTLMKIISGVLEPDGGEILLDGKRLQFAGPSDAVAAGIQTVFQDLALCDNLDVTANLFLGHEHTAGWGRFLPPLLRPLAKLEMESDALNAVRKLQVYTLASVRSKVAGLSGGQRQAVAIARAVRTDSTVVLLDEPTAALGVAQTAHVLELVGQLRANGHGIIYVSHNLRDVFEVCDSITVLWHGANAGTWQTSDTNADEIVVAITRGKSDGSDRDRA